MRWKCLPRMWSRVMGLESPRASYAKLQGADTVALTRELHSHGIKVLGSTIIGLEPHTPENIQAEIRHAVSHETDFHQFMLYTPAPGTPLYAEMLAESRMLESIDVAECMARTSSTSVTQHFPRRFEALAGLGLSARLRSQWSQSLQDLQNDTGRLAAA